MKCARQSADDFETEFLPKAHCGVVVETTKLNCIARKPRRRASLRQCSAIARPIPWPRASGATMKPLRDVRPASRLVRAAEYMCRECVPCFLQRKSVYPPGTNIPRHRGGHSRIESIRVTGSHHLAKNTQIASRSPASCFRVSQSLNSTP